MQCGAHVRYEGLNERLFLETLNLKPYLEDVQPQPLEFRFKETAKRQRKYTPDFLVRYAPIDSNHAFLPMLVEVKTRRELKDELSDFLPGFQIASDYCRAQGWRFRIVTDTYLQSPYAQNARFLFRYIGTSPDQTVTENVIHMLKQRGPTPVNIVLETLSQDLETQMMAVPTIWHMLASSKLGTDLRLPLGMRSLIWGHRYG